MAPMNRPEASGPPSPVGSLADSAAGVMALLAEIGGMQVKWVEVFRDRLVVHPARRSEGAAIAALLGVTVATDYPTTTPGFTLWTGHWNGIDVHVYGDLRGTARTIRPWPV